MDYKFILRYILLPIVSLFFLYSSKSDFEVNLLKNNIGFLSGYAATELKDSFLLISVVLGAIFIPLDSAFTRKTLESQNKKIKGFLKQGKESFSYVLQNELKTANSNFNVRLFLPKKKWYSKLIKDKTGFLEFKLVEIPGLSTKISRDLSFQVHPSPEGLVGKTYQTKNIIVDGDLSNPTKQIFYNLNDYQNSKTTGTEFCITAPIFSKNNAVIAIISIDTSSHVNMTAVNNNSLRKLIIQYSEFIHENYPAIKKLPL